jgi:HlyD family secretion protein
VDESDIGSVQVGQTVDITADAFPGTHFDGKVVRIATQGVNTSNVVTFEVKIEVVSKNRDLLKPQMTANVQIIEQTRSNAVQVPMMSIIRKLEGTFVTVVKPDNSTEERAVTLGINDGENQEITSGLTGDELILVHRSDINSVWSASKIAKRVRGMTIPGRK